MEIGRKGRSTFDMSVARVRYLTGVTEFNPDPFDRSGVSVIDLEDKKLIDFYGKNTGPSLLGSSITSGDKLE